MSNKKTSHQNQKITYLIEAEDSKKEIKNSESQKLKGIINYLKNNPQSVIKITGQSNYSIDDKKHKEEDAKSLAKNRADHIFQELVKKDIDNKRILIGQPIAHTEIVASNRSTKIEIVNNSDIDMVFNGHDFADGGKSQAMVIAELWKNSDENKILFLTGGATPEGSPNKNNILAQKRAETLKRELETLGVPADHIVINRKPNLNAKKASVEIDFYDRTTKVISSDNNVTIPFNTKSILEKGQNLDDFKIKAKSDLDKTLTARNTNSSEMNEAQKQNQINNFKNNYSQMGYKIDGYQPQKPAIKMNISR